MREILARYLPQQLGDDELAALAREAVAAVEAETGQAPGPRQMGQVMKKAQAAAAGIDVDASRISAPLSKAGVHDQTGLLDAPRAARGAAGLNLTVRRSTRTTLGTLAMPPPPLLQLPLWTKVGAGR